MDGTMSPTSRRSRNGWDGRGDVRGWAPAGRSLPSHPARHDDISGSAGAGPVGFPVAGRFARPVCPGDDLLDRPDRDGGQYRHVRGRALPSLRRRIGHRGSASRTAPRPRGAPLRKGRGAERAFDAGMFEGRDMAGKAVLLRSGWDARWGTPAYFDGHPYLTRAGAQALVAAGAALVGTDSLNIDDTGDGERPAHTLLLAAGIPIVEHLRGLAALPGRGFRFHCAPAPFGGMGSFPVRAYAVIGSGKEVS